MKRLLLLFLLGGLALPLAGMDRSARADDAQIQNVTTAPVRDVKELEPLDWQLPNEKWLTPYQQRVPIVFVNQGKNLQEWLKLPRLWNEGTEIALDPVTGAKAPRKVIRIKLPLGLTQDPPVPLDNEMTLERWALGKKLYFDPVLSSDNSVSCATCHDPQRGWTDQSPVSVGIGGGKGGMSAPTVLNTAYNAFQFWDGRADSLEDQAQGPVGNPVEMFNNKGHAWRTAVLRVREKKGYLEAFKKAYGTEPTRDTIAKAIAVYERTVLSGNSIHDRADFAMKLRVAEEGGTEFKFEAEDYAKILKEAFQKKDVPALTALGLDPAKDQGKVPEVARSLANGQQLFFGKARCNSCHVGQNFTDNQFHNLGVGVKDFQLPADGLGRYGALPTGHKNPEMIGAFKTPTLRGLTATGPYMHNGSEKSLEEVVEFYNHGGNPNRYLAPKMRDFDAEKAYILARQTGQPYQGPKVYLFAPDQTPVVPKVLNLTAPEKRDLVLFLRALQGDPVDPIVADPNRTLPAFSANGGQQSGRAE